MDQDPAVLCTPGASEVTGRSRNSEGGKATSGCCAVVAVQAQQDDAEAEQEPSQREAGGGGRDRPPLSQESLSTQSHLHPTQTLSLHSFS